MATIEDLAKNPRAFINPLRRIEWGIQRNPIENYEELARYVVVMIAGPDAVHDFPVEEENKTTFRQSLERCINAIEAGNNQLAVKEARAWDTKWKESDSTSGPKTLLPEHLMPVALNSVEIVKRVFDDHIVFISQGFEEKRASTVSDYLKWAFKVVTTGEVDAREFFSKDLSGVLPIRKI
ncbi:MAG: hypothetical protein HYT07_03415 [Candidatus Levybacteria bacterium]|nr:hypothetical protein [Candidatus Levybacteria bacterium]